MLDLRSAWMAWVLLLSLWLPLAQGMKDNQIKELRYFPPPPPSLSLLYSFLTSHPRLFVLRAGANNPGGRFRQETEHMFYHGFDNYMRHAYPEDELRPLTCGPLVRDRDNPGRADLNDVLGNYSLTLIDTLSTLAILSSSPENGEKSLSEFQNGVKDFVRLYGDGSDGPAGQGERQRGFDVDSKVQVFETVIRGLGTVSFTRFI